MLDEWMFSADSGDGSSRIQCDWAEPHCPRLLCTVQSVYAVFSNDKNVIRVEPKMSRLVRSFDGLLFRMLLDFFANITVYDG